MNNQNSSSYKNVVRVIQLSDDRSHFSGFADPKEP